MKIKFEIKIKIMIGFAILLFLIGTFIMVIANLNLNKLSECSNYLGKAREFITTDEFYYWMDKEKNCMVELEESWHNKIQDWFREVKKDE